ncbi:MAG: Ig-like domain-containing protein, partial [Rubrobacteraceae bacterium]
IVIVSVGDTTVGGTTAGAQNVIAFNGQDGVQVFGGLRHAILGNSVFSNGLLGINLGSAAGVTPNDTGDPDTGPNNLQNFPVLTSVSVSGGNVSVSGTLNSVAAKTYRLEFFASDACDASGFGEGRTFIGTTDVTTDGGGNASFGPLSFPAPSDQPAITATATDPDNNTSEFSQCRSAIDVMNPGITITTPAEGAEYTLDQDVKADYTCNDEAGGSGLKSCAGPVANGAAIDTSSLGTKSFTVNAEDNAGNKSALTRTYEVIRETTRPTVISVSPAENATGVPRNTNVTATFSEAMEEASVEAAGVVKLVKQGRTNAVAASVTYDAVTRKVTLDPNANLEAGTAYTATVTTGAKDLAGNALAADKTWTFTTAGTPPPPIDTNPLPKKLRNDLIVFARNRVTPDNPAGDQEIFVTNLTFGASVTQLTFNDWSDTGPKWSPDGTKIAFVRGFGAGNINSEIYVMNANGLAQTRLTNNNDPDNNPTWSPDGKQIAFDRIPETPIFEVIDWEIFKMQANGANQVQLTNNTSQPFTDGSDRRFGIDDTNPAWSPDGRTIAFESNRDSIDGSTGNIFTMKADGTEQTNRTNSPSWDNNPAWSPDGKKIAFDSRPIPTTNGGYFDIHTMNASGANRRNVTNSPAASDYWPAWSPGSTFIAFSSVRDGSTTDYNIFTIKADGSNQTNRTNNAASDVEPDWLKQ